MACAKHSLSASIMAILMAVYLLGDKTYPFILKKSSCNLK